MIKMSRTKILETIAQCHERGITAKKYIAEVLGVSPQVLYYWMKKDEVLRKAIKFGIVTENPQEIELEIAKKMDEYTEYQPNARYEAYRDAQTGSFTDYRDYILQNLNGE